MHVDLPSFESGTKPTRRQLQNCVAILKTVANMRFGTGINGKFVLGSGLTIAADLPQRKTKVAPTEIIAGGTIRLAVVKDVGDGLNRFVSVKAITRDDADPWEGGYVYDGDTAPVACWPGTKSGDYTQYVWPGDTIEPPVTHILPVIQTEGGDWYIQQYRRTEYKNLTGLRISDCQLVPV